MRPALPMFIATLCLAAGAAHAFDVPKRKSGLWEMTTSGSQAKGSYAMQMCIDEKTDDILRDRASGQAKQSCSKSDMRREGDRIVFDSVCTFSGSTATTHGVLTGKFDSAYRMESKSTYEPPLMGKKEGAMTIDAKWVGPCKPEQKPGDMVMPGMGAMNMDEMMKRMPKQ